MKLTAQQQHVVNGTPGDEYWDEMVTIARNNDRVPFLLDPAMRNWHAIRVDGHHYLAHPGIVKNQAMKGYGGRVFYWIERSTGIHYFSNNVWSQGEIPAGYRNALPDNAEFTTHQRPCICTRSENFGRVLDPDCLR